MNKYPENMSPIINERNDKVPFGEWWVGAQNEFPGVPVSVAQYWIYEHWDWSPFGWLNVKEYSFRLTQWPSSEIKNLLANNAGFSDSKEEVDITISSGKCMIERAELNSRAGGWETPMYMLKNRKFPEPVIILDNRDGHLVPPEDSMINASSIPFGWILIEGHKRRCMAAYLASIGKFGDVADVWLMERVC